MRRAHELTRSWMVEAGMEARTDNIGNLRGVYPGDSPGAATLLLGSHLDSVRDAGRYDGPLGVVVAIAAVQSLHEARRRLPYAIEVIAFADEEGLRFGSSYLGSRAVAGTFDTADLALLDSEGTSMAEAVRAFGGDPSQIALDRWSGPAPLGYCEVHIEQGPVLEALDLPVAVVSAIAGQARHLLTFEGAAGHAGTVPMGRRHDALTGAAEFVLAVEEEARAFEGLVATVGKLDVQPGAANVIPGSAVLTLDLRHADDARRAEVADRVLRRGAEIAERRGLSLAIHPISDSPAVRCAPKLSSLMARAIEDAGHRATMLTSGAGHDGVAISALTDICMLFVRCKGGISHNPAESVTEQDVAAALDVLGRFLELLTQG
jgi:allantoate deiminase